MSDNQHDEILDLAIKYVTAKAAGLETLYPDGICKDKKRMIRNRAAKIKMVNNELMYEKQKKMMKIVTDQQEQKRIMISCHSDETSGHFGVRKTVARISERFYWRGMWPAVEKYVSKC